VSSVNLYAKEISVKIVYYGPGLGGKTSSLQHIHQTMRADARGQLVSLSTGVDRTLYFDFLPIKLPKLRGFTVRVQLYTVPGQVHYNSTRKLVLTGADGVVFVADSQEARREANIESLTNLRENLEEQGSQLDAIPYLIQYNKRDLPNCMSILSMEQDLNPRRMPFFETCATSGRGVFEALKSITTLVLSDLRRRGIWRNHAPAVEPDAQLMELRDESSEPSARRSTTESSISASLQALTERAAEEALPSLRPLQPETAPAAPQANMYDGEGLSSILPAGPARESVVRVEYLLQRHDYAGAVNIAARVFADAAQSTATVGNEGPALYALMLGLAGDRYLRFKAVVDRASSSSSTSADAAFALFFLVDIAMRKEP